MPEQVLTILKICLLILIYLFFLRVLRAVWAEDAASKGQDASTPVRDVRPAHAGSGTLLEPNSVSVPAPTMGSNPAITLGGPRPAMALVVREPMSMSGHGYSLDSMVTIGRDPASTIPITDGFVSLHHARFYPTPGGVVVEDVGSTNGTFVNDARIAAVTPVSSGDLIRCGNLVLEAK